MTTAIVLFSYFSGIEVPFDLMAVLAMVGDFVSTTAAAVLIVLV